MSQTNVEFMSDETAALPGYVAQISPVPGFRFAFQPIGVIAGIDAKIFVGGKLQSGLRCVNIVPGEIIVSRPRLVEAVKSIEAFITAAGSVSVRILSPVPKP